MAFPTTNVLDTFSDTEGPPMTGWSTPALVSGLKSAGGVCLANAANALGIWNTVIGGADEEVYFTITTATGAGGTVSCFVRAKDTGSALTFDAYGLVITEAATDIWEIDVFTNGAATLIGERVNQEVANGDVIGLRVVGSVLTAFLNGVELFSRTDTTYTAAGYIGAAISDTTGRIDNFGGGITVYTETAKATFGTKASGAEVYSAGGTLYTVSGAAIFGAKASVADTASNPVTARAVFGAKASATDKLSVTETARAVFGATNSTLDRVANVETGRAVFVETARASDTASNSETGRAVFGASNSAAESAANSETGRAVFGTQDSASERAAYVDAGLALFGETASGVATYTDGGTLYTVAGRAVFGETASVTDGAVYPDTASAVFGLTATVRDNPAYVDAVRALFGSVVSVQDVGAFSETSRALFEMTDSVSASIVTQGEAGKIDCVRELGDDVAQDGTATRAQLTAVVQSQMVMRGKGNRVA